MDLLAGGMKICLQDFSGNAAQVAFLILDLYELNQCFSKDGFMGRFINHNFSVWPAILTFVAPSLISHSCRTFCLFKQRMRPLVKLHTPD